MSTIQLKLYELLAAVAILFGICVGVWFAADAHYSKEYVSLKAQYEQQAKDQQAQVQAQIAANKAESERIENAYKQQVAARDIALGDLSVRLKSGYRALQVCTASAGPNVVGQQANGSGATAGAGATQATQAAIAIDPAVLADALEIGIGALSAEQAWRDYAKTTGQVQ